MSVYKALKNHIHNTLDITKENIREMVESAVERIVERKLDILFEQKFNSQYNVQHMIDESIKRNLTEKNWYWGESKDTLDDYVKKEVVRSLLKGVKLKVELSKTKRDATDPGLVEMN